MGTFESKGRSHISKIYACSRFENSDVLVCGCVWVLLEISGRKYLGGVCMMGVI